MKINLILIQLLIGIDVMFLVLSEPKSYVGKILVFVVYLVAWVILWTTYNILIKK